MGIVLSTFKWLIGRPTNPLPMTDKQREEAQRKLGIDTVRQYNYAFAGLSGQGKSSLINVILQVKDNDAHAAKVGDIEGTKEITKHEVPRCPHAKLWDIPGAGTTSYNAETYFKDKKLYAFDCLIIVIGNRVMDVDRALAKAADQANVPVAFVRSKSDVDLRNKSEENDCEVSAIKEAYHKSATDTIRKELSELELVDPDVFVVSSKVMRYQNYSDYKLDEDRLVQWIMDTAKRRRS